LRRCVDFGRIGEKAIDAFAHSPAAVNFAALDRTGLSSTDSVTSVEAWNSMATVISLREGIEAKGTQSDADSLASRQEPTTPLGHSLGFAAERGFHNRLDLLGPVGRFAPSPRRYFPQTIQALLVKAASPQHDGLAIQVQLLSDGIVRLSCGSR
jgi:hypothetical protein